MTLPANLYDLPTLQSVLEQRGDPVADVYQCPGCPRALPATGLVHTINLPGSLPAFVCHTCASGPHREALAAQATAERLAAGPDWSACRVERNRLLTGSDWTQVADAPISESVRGEWQAYRQQLRDITNTFASPEDVVWPDAPSGPSLQTATA